MYDKWSTWGKILLISVVLVCATVAISSWNRRQRASSASVEGFEGQHTTYVTLRGPEVYDTFYSQVYDHLVYNNMKDEYEVGEIMNATQPSQHSRVLDVGCGTGHMVAQFASKNIPVLGLDVSAAMVAKAKELYPRYSFQVGDVLQSDLFAAGKFTHILCLYFTLYYMKDKQQFFDNCMQWLTPGGHLIVHVVDRERFDPILPPGNPLLYVSPQKYAPRRITSTQVKFNDFSYKSNFDLQADENLATFTERFHHDSNGQRRTHEHVLYMPPISVIVDQARTAGFVLQSIVDLVHCQYEYQYLYMFVKPSS